MNDGVLVDTNKLRHIIEQFSKACINTIIYFELVRGEPNKERFATMEEYLKRFELTHLEPLICERAIDILRRYKFSHGLDFPDALIAATAIEHELYLFTGNRKDFAFINDLKIL